MTDTAIAALRLSATLVAGHFRFRCERKLRYEMVPESQRGGEIPARNADPTAGPLVGARPGTELLRREGRRWEARALRRLIGRAGGAGVEVEWGERGDAEPLPWDRVRERLRDGPGTRLLAQPEIRLDDPDAFARRFGFAGLGVLVASARPDVLRVRCDAAGALRVDVLDIKAGARATVAHRAQVAFYALLLEEACRQDGVRVADDGIRGWVWARGAGRPRRFPLPPYRHHVERFLGTDLVRSVAKSPAECRWHLAAACTGCAFFHHCHVEAERTDDLARVAGITPLAAEALRARGIRTATQFARSARRDTLQGSHVLESRGARLQKQAQALLWKKAVDLDGFTHLIPPREDVRLFVSADADPVSGRCFALGVRVTDAVREEEEVFLAADRRADAEAEMVAGWLARVDAEVRRGAGTTVHLYVWDRAELDLLHALLLRHLDRAALHPHLGRLLRLATGKRGEGLRASLGSVLCDAVGALFALPVAYAYDLASVSAALQPDEAPWVHRPRPGFALPFSSQVAFERIHDVWSLRPFRTSGGDEPPDAVAAEIRRTVASRLRAADSVLRAIRERAGREAKRRGISRLQLRKEPLAEAEADPPLADPLLERLRVFATMESVHEAMAIRQLHHLPVEERTRRFECIRGLELRERLPGGRLLFEFDPACRDAKFRVGDFSLLLTNDDGRSLVGLERRPWERARLQVELVALDAGSDPPLLTLATRSDFARAEADGIIDLDRVCVLDRSGSDVNTRRILATLRALADGHGPRDAVGALLRREPARGPAGPLCAADAEAVEAALLEPAGRRRGAPVLNPEQAAAWRAALERPLSLVWGPPGTGKTYLLAWIVLGIAEARRRRGLPCRILVTAATHRAVVNVLARLAREAEAAGVPFTPRLLKLRGSGNEADRDLDGLPVELIEDARLPGILGAGAEAPVVAGSTVWSLWKQMRGAARAEAGALDGADGQDPPPVRPWFDLVVIDEASQMKLPEALIAVSSLRDGGQVILCGDHQQLAPVIHGRYGDAADTLFGSVFAHVAAGVPPLPLRESRRMNEALVEYPRTHFYPGLVSVLPGQRIGVGPHTTEEAEVDRLLAECFLAPEAAVVLCTYSGVRAAARNPFEAGLAARLVRLARGRLLDPATAQPYADDAFVSHALAVIAPHRAQNSAILAAIRALGLPDSSVPVVDTVERMQGNEREMVIVSYGVADREYAEAEAEFLLDPHRFNVSITRARSKLVLLLSEEVLAAVPRDEEVLAGAMMIHGYPAHCADGAREVELPGPAGERVRARIQYRKLAADPLTEGRIRRS
jgi:DNA replication ATP-dependent helicase Dna2